MTYTKKFTGPRCPACKVKMHHPNVGLLLQHVRIVHAQDVSPSHYEALTSTGAAKYLKALPSLPSFTIHRKRFIVQGNIDWCCVCMRENSQLWVYKNALNPSVSVCAACREKMLSAHKADIFGSGRLVPGSYGSGGH